MPERDTMKRAERDREQGKAPTTQGGEFVREEMEHAKTGKHPVKSRKQAVAIGLSKARRSGIKVPQAKRGNPAPQARRRAAARKQAKKPAPRSW